MKKRLQEIAFVAGVVAVAVSLISFGVELTHTDSNSSLPACVTEDSANCYWDGDLNDRNGRSFIDIDGVAYYQLDK